MRMGKVDVLIVHIELKVLERIHNYSIFNSMIGR